MKSKRKPTLDPADRARSYLERYRPAAERVTLLQRRLERLRERATAPPSPTLDGLPRGTRAGPDRIGDLLALVDETEAELREAQREAGELRAEIRAAIRWMPGTTARAERERMLLLARYVDGERWRGCAEILFGDRENYIDQAQGFERQCHRIHNDALLTLSKTLMEDSK